MKFDKFIAMFITIVFLIVLISNFIEAYQSDINLSEKEQLFKQKCGENWKIEWDNKSNTPNMVFGSSCNLLNNKEKEILKSKFMDGIGKGVNNKNEIKPVTDLIITETNDLLNVDKSNLKLLKVGEGNDEWYVEYQQYYNNIPVENSEVGMTIDKNGNLLMVGSNYHNDINIDITPKIKEKDAIELAKKYLNFDDTPDERPDFINKTILIKVNKIKELNESNNLSLEENKNLNEDITEKNITIQIKVNKIKKEINSTLVILPKENNESYDYGLVWKIKLYSSNPIINKEIFIDTQTGQILKERNLVLDNFNIDGYTSGYIYPQHHYDTTQLKTFTHLRDFLAVWDEDILGWDLVGTPLVGTGSSNYYNTGSFFDNCAGTYDTLSCADPQVDAYLYGDYAAAINYLSDDYYYSTPSISDLSGSGRLDVYYTANAETNAYYHANYIHNFYKSSPFNYNNMDYQMWVYTNVNMDNAYFDGNYQGDTYFGNVREYAKASDVIYHEYTHAVIDTIYYPSDMGYVCDSPSDEGSIMNEAIADYFAASTTNDAIIGESLFTPYLRNLQNIKQLPSSPVECHTNEFFSGALWDIRTSLSTSTTDRLIFEAMRNVPHPDTFAEMFDNILIEDDNNADLRDGTSNGESIFTAFNNHGMDFNDGPWSSIHGVSTNWTNSDDMGLVCVGGDTDCKPTKKYYFDADGVCSNNKADYIYSTTSNALTINTTHNDYLCLLVEDYLGDYNTAVSSQLKVDATPPEIIINSPSNTTYNTGIIYLNYTINDITSWCGYSLNENANITLEGNTTLENLTQQSYQLNLYCNDSLGNMGSNKVTFIVDWNDAPIISSVSISPSEAYTNSDLICNNGTVIDDDNDLVSLFYLWYENNISQENLTTKTILSTNTTKEENWICGIIPNDGFINGTQVNSSSIMILNSYPILNAISNITANESDLVYVNVSGEVWASDIDSDILTFNYSHPLNSSGYWQTNFSSDGNHTMNITVSDGILSNYQEIMIIINNDFDRDGVPDYVDLDDDNDGINDSEDALLGNSSDILTNVNNLTLEIEDSQDLNKIFNGIQNMKFKENNDTLIEFNFNFSESNLNLENIKIEKQTETDSKGSILIKGIQLTTGETKTAYINNLDSSSNSVCIKDEEISSITEISSNCNGASEIIVSCPGTNGNYICSKVENRYRIDSLSNSGIKEFFVSPPSSGGGSSGGGSSGGGGGGSGGGGGYISPTTPSTTGIESDTNQPLEISNDESSEGESAPITGGIIGILKGKGGYIVIGFMVIVILAAITIFNRSKIKQLMKKTKSKSKHKKSKKRKKI